MPNSLLRPLNANASDEPKANMTQSIRSLSGRPLSGRLSQVALFVGALLLSTLLAAPSSVGQDVVVSTDDVVDSNLQSGDTFEVPVQVENLDQADDVFSYDITLDYGGAPVSFDGFETAGTLTDDAGLTTDQNDDEAAEQASISAFGSDPLSTGGNSGAVVVATFVVESQSSGSVTFPNISFNDVNPPPADTDQAGFDVILSDNILSIEDAIVGVGEPGTVEVSATDLSGLDVTNLDIEITVSDPVELDEQDPVTFVTDELDQNNFNYDASTGTLSVTGFSTGGALTGDEVLFELNAQALSSEATASIAFDDANTEIRNSDGDPITIALNDGSLQAAANNPPTISGISGRTIDEDGEAGPIDFTVGDQDVDPSNLTVDGQSDNTDLVPTDSIDLGGSGADRTVTVTPTADSFGTATISLTVTDPEGAQASESFQLTVDPIADGPVAVDDEYPNDDVPAERVQEDEKLTVSAPNGLRANDRHPDGESFTVSEELVSTPDNGTVDVSADGSFEYTPEADFAGTDQFNYQISDGDSTDTAVVTINVEQVNDQPTISELPDQTIDEDSSAGPIGFTIGDVETDPSNLGLTPESGNTDLVPNDSIKIDRSGTDPEVTVIPTADSFGTATIRLTVTDQEVDGKAPKDSTQSFELTVNSVNDPAVVESNEGLTLDEGTTETIPTDSLSADDVEDDASNLTFDVTGEPSNGTLLVGGSAASTFTQADLESGAVSYSHDGSETTSDSFTFNLRDSAGEGPEGRTFSIDVQPVNDAPTVATNEGLTLDEGTEAAIPTDSLSAEDQDDTASDLTFDVTAGPDNGALLVGGDTSSTFTQADLESGAVSYSHDGSETTSDSFTFDLVDDGGEGPTDQTFSITVQPVNDGPTISGLADADTTINEDSSTDPIGFTVDDAETAPGDLSVTASSSDTTVVPDDSIEVTGPDAQGTGSLTVEPSADSNGTADITVTVENGGELTASQTFTLTVDPVNDSPAISGLPEAVAIDEDSSTDPIGFDVSDLETPVEDLSVTASSSDTTLVPDDSIDLGFGVDGRALTVTPSADSNGTADITVTVEDGGELTDSQTFTLTVESVPDAPVAVDDEYTTDEGEGLVPDIANGLLANDRDADGDDLQTATFPLEGPENGSVNINPDGTFRYTPESGFAGTDQFVYRVSDGDSTDTGTVTVNVEAIEVTISGTVTYPSVSDGELADGEPLNGIPVEVASAESGEVAARDTTGSDGTFSVGVRTGEYVVDAQIDRDVPSAINATDANRTIQAYLGNIPFTGDFQAEVADVNDSGSANATDALKMALFFNDPSGTTFEAGDWATTARTADVTSGSDASVSVLAAAYGDANLSGDGDGSSAAVATTSSSTSQASTNREGESDLRGVKMDGSFEVPVRLSSAATVGSYSLEIDFPADKVSFEGVAGTDRNVMATAEEGTVRLSWFDQSGNQPMKVGTGASLTTLRFSAAGDTEEGTAFRPEVTTGELSGPDAQPIGGAEVTVEGVKIGSNLPDEFALQGSYPNPVSSGQATVEMDLPSRATVTVEVYNTLGQRVQTMEQSMSAGTGQTLQMDGSQLASGQYFYRVKADLGDSVAEETGQITVVR